MFSKRWVLLLFSLAVLACTPEPTEKTWADKTYDERLTFMGETFYPAFKAIFSDFDDARYGHPAGEQPKFQCTTCHGADASKNKYKMPAAVALDPNNLPTADDPVLGKFVKLMNEKVLPKAKELLPQVNFTCFTCHLTK